MSRPGLFDKNEVVKKNIRAYETMARLDAIAWLVHGFGTAAWQEVDFSHSPEFSGMSRIVMNQVHSAVVHSVRGRPSRKLEGDALVTDIPGLMLSVKTADCLPAFIVDIDKAVVAAVHCGWRGTAKRILQNTLDVMAADYLSRPADCLAAFGPRIGPSCYEVGPEVQAAFSQADFPPHVFTIHPSRKDRFLLDLGTANRWILTAAGVPEENILSFKGCTHCSPFYLSFRRDKDKEHRMFNFIGIRPTPGGELRKG